MAQTKHIQATNAKTNNCGTKMKQPLRTKQEVTLKITTCDMIDWYHEGIGQLQMYVEIITSIVGKSDATYIDSLPRSKHYINMFVDYNQIGILNKSNQET